MIEVSFKDGRKILVSNPPDINAQQIDFESLGAGRFHIISQNKTYSVEYDHEAKFDSGNIVFKFNGKRIEVNIRTESDILLEKLGINTNKTAALGSIKAPMPGLIFQLLVQPGDSIDAGMPLLVLEAMKMENVIRALGSVKVAKVFVKVGDKVEKGQLLVEFES